MGGGRGADAAGQRICDAARRPRHPTARQHAGAVDVDGRRSAAARVIGGLGVSGLLVGAAGWAGIEVGRRQLGGVLNQAAGDIRRIADVTVDLAEASLHAWLNATLIAGAVLVVCGVAVAMLGGLTGRLRAHRRPAPANR